MIGLVAVTAAGRAAAADLAARWPEETVQLPGPTAAAAVADGWRRCTALVCFLATGATVRLVAPLLADKHTDPAVVCVDEARRFAVALTGGHAGGANALAERVAAALGATPVVTTASDRAGLAGLDTLGWPVAGDVAGVGRALLDGEPVWLRADRGYPLPALGAQVGEHPAAAYTLHVTDRVVPQAPGVAVLHPPTLVLGVGAARGVAAVEVLDLVDAALAGAGLAAASVHHVATVAAKAGEAGLLAAAERRGWPVVAHPAADLAAVAVPSPSPVVQAAVGTPSVAEAAALHDAEELVVPKRKSAAATVAVARRRLPGRLALVGLGPGARDLLTPRARAELARAAVVVGLDQYVDQVRDLLRPDTRILASGLGSEEERARTAVAEARRGLAVALVGSGDAGVYAMASPALAYAGDADSAAVGGRAAAFDVVGVPGVTAALAAAALLGAPLGHDHAAVSLSDLHTPWEVVLRRVQAAAEGDFVVTFYNPRSAGRDWQLAAALAVLARYRSPGTPVGVVRDATREGQQVRVTCLADLDVTEVDMRSVVVVGNRSTRVVAGRMVTPRGYRWQS